MKLRYVNSKEKLKLILKKIEHESFTCDIVTEQTQPELSLQ